jgi:o-succinylbenzoate synthase
MFKVIETATLEKIKIVDVVIPYLIPFAISGGTCDVQRSIVVELASDGIVGYGESAPVEVPIYSSETTSSAIAALKEWFIPKIAGKSFESIEHFNEVLAEETRGNNFAKAAIETAYWDLIARKNNISMKDLIHYKLKQLNTTPQYLEERDYILSGVSIGIPEGCCTGTLKRWIEEYLQEGYKRVKLKIKPGWELPAFKAAREVIGYDFPLWGDANSAYSLDKHLDILKRIDDFNCLFLEQPLHHDDLIDHIKLSRQLKTRICLDESLKSYRLASQVVDSGVNMVWNLKIHRMGGLWETLKIYALASRHGIDVWGGTMPETGIGTVAMLCLASFGGFKYPSDVEDSARWYGRGNDLIEIQMDNQGRIPVPVGVGVGEINMDNYNKFGKVVYEYSINNDVVKIPITTSASSLTGIDGLDKLSIKRAECTEEVIKRIKELEEQGFGEGAWDEWVIVPYIRHGKVFLLRYDGEITGYSMFMRDWDKPDNAYFLSTTVENDSRGKGFATLLIKESLSMLRSEGIVSVELTVAPDNYQAIHIYKDKFGFKEVSLNKNEYGDGQDRLVMRLNLASLY